MTAQIIDGKKIGQIVKDKVAKKIQELKKQNSNVPTIAVILVGDNHASKIYVAAKERQAKEVGMNSIKIELDANITEADLIEEINTLNKNKEINAILVQLPLPKHIDSQQIIMAIDPAKDVDGFHPINVGKLTIGDFRKSDQSAIVPCTALGCLHLIEEVERNLVGKNILVIGSSNIVGMPVSRLMMYKKATVTIANSKTTNLSFLCKNADVIISATGVAGLIKEDMVNNHTIIIDVGINRINLADGAAKLTGDVDFDNVKNKVRAITPVPGGVGPMTIAYLLNNCLDLFIAQNK